MRWHNQLLIVMAVFAALATAGAALAAPRSLAGGAQIKGSVENGTLTVTGTNAADSLTLVLASDPTKLDVVSGSDTILSFDRSTFDKIVVDAGGGDDLVRIDQFGGAFTDAEATTLDGQGGDDTLLGGDGNETLVGGSGNDFIDGNRGSDLAFMGSGNDTFQWDPGDGSDTVEGQSGKDTMLFNGANIAEKIDLSANGHRLRFTRDIAGITMDTDGVETVNINALGGVDTITVHDLTGTDVNTVNTNLAATGGTGDGQPDTVIANGTAAADHVHVEGGVVSGLGASVEVEGGGIEPQDTLVVGGLGGDDQFSAPPAQPITVRFDGGDDTDTTTVEGSSADDTIGIAAVAPAVAVFSSGPGFVQSVAENLLVQGRGGDDNISGQNGIQGLTALTLDGGTGDDTLLGGDGNDTLLGGSGNDFIDGNRGADLALMGSGNDTFQWDPGDGSDTVEGQAGKDTMLFNGSNAGEKIDLSANGSRLRLFRDVGAITMDTDGVETVTVNALGGVDTVTVHDLSGTDVDHVNANLAATGGGGDSAADKLVVEGTQKRDVIKASGSGGSATVKGLAADVNISGAEVAADTLEIDALAGNDTVDASGLAADAISLKIDGGEGDDRLTGGVGDDVIVGGPGNDILDGGPGNNTLIQ